MDWKSEAQEKLRRYDAMRLAAINIPQEIKRLELDACSIRAAQTDATPVKGGGRREDAMLSNLVLRQELGRTLEQTRLWLEITDQALDALTPEEKQILERLYIYPQKDGLARLCRDLCLEQSTVYRKRDKALRRFTLACYGQK